MNTETGTICGFVPGMSGFLYLFKSIFLVNIPPSDELAPGIVYEQLGVEMGSTTTK